jgi:nucleotide-binding universal stress UspA family protein
MPDRPSIVCPIDFSDTSRTALNYAAAIAETVGARLLVVSVDDPLLASAAESAGFSSLNEETEDELRRFVMQTVVTPSSRAALDFVVRTGKPAPEILRIAQEAGSRLIVMSSQGRSGLGKAFFGSTTERVLRETTIPVLVTPRDAKQGASMSDMSRRLGRVIAPVDLTAASPDQVKIAAAIALALGVPLLLAHILESVYIPPRVRAAISGTDSARRGEAEARILDLVESSRLGDSVETIVLSGDPSEEIVKLADARGAGLIVMGLHSSGLLGPRMGSVTYRVLCLARALVLALPPWAAATVLSTTGYPARS